MNFLACDGNSSIDGQGRFKCQGSWVTYTPSQLSAEISVDGNASGITSEVYEMLSNHMAIVFIVAYGWKAVLRVINEKESHDD